MSYQSYKYKNCIAVRSKGTNFLIYALFWLFCLILFKKEEKMSCHHLTNNIQIQNSEWKKTKQQQDTKICIFG